MNTTFDQNHIEAILGLEQLEEHIGQKDFRFQQQRIQELIKNMKLGSAEQADLQARLTAVQERQKSYQSDQSQGVLQALDAKLNQAKELMGTGEVEISFEDQQKNYSLAYNLLEEVHQTLELEKYSLTRQDRDNCWTELKAIRNTLRKARQQATADLSGRLDALYIQAQEAIDTQRYREAKESFQALQREANHLPLRREQRQQVQERFNSLWEQLQVKGKSQREAAQQRRADGIRKLEDALHRVESFILHKEQDIKHQEERSQAAHWNEVDPIERQLQKDRAALDDAKRRQSELNAKLEDARNRKR